MIYQIGIKKHMATSESLSQTKKIDVIATKASLKCATLLIIHLLMPATVHICNTSFHMLNLQWGQEAVVLVSLALLLTFSIQHQRM